MHEHRASRRGAPSAPLLLAGAVCVLLALAVAVLRGARAHAQQPAGTHVRSLQGDAAASGAAAGALGDPSPTVAQTPTWAPPPAPVDSFRPRSDDPAIAPERAPEPALGGSVSLHMTSMPSHLNVALSGGSGARRILRELHETLIRFDWETWQRQPDVASRWTIEDQLVLTEGARERHAGRARTILRRPPHASDPERERIEIVFGELERREHAWRVTPRSEPGEPFEVPDADVREVVRGGVATFVLREDVFWHPVAGFEKHAFDARDVTFSFSIYRNPLVECDAQRYQFEKVAGVEALDAHRVRFFFGQQDAWVFDDVAGSMCLLPSHLYDLSDPDNPAFDAEATPQAQARAVNENPHNKDFVGLGPYRLERLGEQTVEARRFDGYFDPRNAGYLDRIRWRAIRDDGAALQALLSGEIDTFDRISAEDLFGPATQARAFTERLYKGWFQPLSYNYVCWNMRREALADVRVRQAFNHCLDVDDLVATWYRGTARRITGPQPYDSPGYDHSVPPTPFDLGAATRLLAEAGWYDRDGDGWVDREGKRLSVEFAAIAGAKFTTHLAQLLQENLKRVGVEMTVREYEYSALLEKIDRRDFDAFSQAWLPPLEPDPEQLWHSRSAHNGANHAGLCDAEVDRLIDAGQRELDDAARFAIWRRLHARLAELAPYLFLVNGATRFAFPKRLWGQQSFVLDPGYSVRRWYLPAGTPGTRPADGVGHWSTVARGSR